MPISATAERIEFRVSPDLKHQLEQAASATGLTVAAFVKTAALNTARQTLRDQRQLQLDNDSWDKFLAAVAQPGQVAPGLADLLDVPSVFRSA